MNGWSKRQALVLWFLLVVTLCAMGVTIQTTWQSNPALNALAGLTPAAGTVPYFDSATTAALATVSEANDVAFASSWNGDDVNSPTKNALYDYLHLIDTDDDGGVNKLENAADPDVAGTGLVGLDTDGANEPNDIVLRVANGSGGTQYALASSRKTIQATIIKPQDMADTERDLCPIWHNNTGMTFTITEIIAWSDTDNTTVTVEWVASTDWSGPATVDALEIATDGTTVFTDTQTAITDATIAHDEIITLDFDDTDDPGVVKISITGYFNANVD